MQNGFFRFFTQFIEKLPIRLINFTDRADKQLHDKMVFLVDSIMELHVRKPRTPQERDMVNREIDSRSKQIDALAYELYRLTEDDVKVIEAKA